MERESAEKDALIRDLQHSHRLAEDEAKRLQDELRNSSAEAGTDERERVQADVLAVANNELLRKLSEMEASLAETARMRDRAEKRFSDLEKRTTEADAVSSILMARVQEAEGALQRAKTEKRAELEEKDRELLRLRSAHSEGSRIAFEAAEQVRWALR